MTPIHKTMPKIHSIRGICLSVPAILLAPRQFANGHYIIGGTLLACAAASTATSFISPEMVNKFHERPSTRVVAATIATTVYVLGYKLPLLAYQAGKVAARGVGIGIKAAFRVAAGVATIFAGLAGSSYLFNKVGRLGFNALTQHPFGQIASFAGVSIFAATALGIIGKAGWDCATGKQSFGLLSLRSNYVALTQQARKTKHTALNLPRDTVVVWNKFYAPERPTNATDSPTPPQLAA